MTGTVTQNTRPGLDPKPSLPSSQPLCVLWFAFSTLHGSSRVLKMASVYYTKHKPKNKKNGGGLRTRTRLNHSLVPRPHPAHARRRGLVSQVQILGLAPETWSGQSYRRTAFIGIMQKREQLLQSYRSKRCYEIHYPTLTNL